MFQVSINVFLLTDNVVIFRSFYRIILEKNLENVSFKFFCSPSSKEMFFEYDNVSVMDVKKEYKFLIDNADLVISCHCKKIFPPELVNTIRCINVHPGLNPFNRGWYPQVFAINNGLPHGATIHEMDEDIDHGNIIVQKEVVILECDTSKSVYDRVLNTEIELFEKNFESIIYGKYSTTEMPNEGNYNSINDFRDMLEIDLDRVGSFREFFNLLRSLTHEPYMNAYFYDNEGEKYFIGIDIRKEK